MARRVKRQAENTNLIEKKCDLFGIDMLRSQDIFIRVTEVE
jgi:hypothetical protein